MSMTNDTFCDELTNNELDAVTGGATHVDTRPVPVHVYTDAEIAAANAWSTWMAMVHAGVFN